VRLRIAEKRGDLAFFLELYDQLRGAPGVEEITMDPRTGSVLLRFDEQRRNSLFGTLADSPLIAVVPPPGFGFGDRGRTEAGPIGRFLASRGTSVTDPRLIVTLIMLGLAVRQLLKGQLLAPAVTLALYGFEILVLLKRGSNRTDGGT
jgi:hypothetical protein